MPRFTAKAPLVRTKPLFGGRLVAAVPTVLTVEPSPDDLEPIDYDLKMTLDVIGERLQCVELCAVRREDGPPVTSEKLRRIPVGQYVQLAAVDLEVVRERVPLNEFGTEFEEIGWSPPLSDFAKDGMTHDALQEAARIYRWAVATGDRPYGLLERGYGLPRAKASRWIATARRRGLLGDEDGG